MIDRQRVININRNYHHSTIIRHLRTITNDIIESTHETIIVNYNTTTTDNNINNNNMNTIVQCNLCMKGRSSTSKHSGIMIPPLQSNIFIELSISE